MTADRPAPPVEPARCVAGFGMWDRGTHQCSRTRHHPGPHVSNDERWEWDDDGTIRPWIGAQPAPPVEPSTDKADDHEPPNGSTVLGFNKRGDVAGAWHRRDDGVYRAGRHWWSTYYDNIEPFTWAEAVRRGASWGHELHTSPTQDAYDRACAALERYRTLNEELQAATVVLGRDNDRLGDDLTLTRTQLTEALNEIDRLSSMHDDAERRVDDLTADDREKNANPWAVS